jgi:hypothetical protein
MRVGWGGEFVFCPTPLGTRDPDRLSRLYVAQIRNIPRRAETVTRSKCSNYLVFQKTPKTAVGYYNDDKATYLL